MLASFLLNYTRQHDALDFYQGWWIIAQIHLILHTKPKITIYHSTKKHLGMIPLLTPIPVSYFHFQYFVFDFHMAPAMLFDKIITLSVSGSYSNFIILKTILVANSNVVTGSLCFQVRPNFKENTSIFSAHKINRTCIFVSAKKPSEDNFLPTQFVFY